MGLKTWSNGEKGHIVKKIIEYNFKLLGKYLSKNILSLSTEERTVLSSDYLSNGLVVFDKTLNEWFEYKDGKWNKLFANAPVYNIDILKDDWNKNKQIHIPYSSHNIINPFVELYILNTNTYESVLGGVSIDNEHNITLSTDLPFNGKVVIK